MGLKTEDSHTRAEPQEKTYAQKHQVSKGFALLTLLLLLTSLMPSAAKAGMVSDFFNGLFAVRTVVSQSTSSNGNVQTMPLLEPAKNIDPAPATGGGDIVIVDSSAVAPDEGPSGTTAEIERPKNATITNYVVRPGDTLSEIAQMHGVSPNTILWANNLPKDAKIKVGQMLVILPITGIKYTVQKGDTIASIAKKYGAQEGDVTSYNGIDDSTLAVGQDIYIPNGEVPEILPDSSHHTVANTKSKSKVASDNEPAHDVGPQGTPAQIGYYRRPLVGGVKTQGIHGYNAVDLAAPIGTPILAAASGDVIVANDGGWNGGYGSYVVIQHDNGSQTLYGHASAVLVSAGDHVTQGQIIARVGTSGRSTGPHVHFEIRDGIRNPF